MKFNNVLDTIGRTPVVKINHLFPEANKKNIDIYIKLERFNPGGSIKDRIALAMIEDAEKSGKLVSGGTVIEPTSGNTGIGLAMVCAVKGYKLILTMPESMSLERRKLMQIYGAELVLTPKEKGMKGAIAKAQELVANTQNAWMPMQFENQSNVEIHAKTTANEIFEDFNGELDYMITGVGTGGHLTGCAQTLKMKIPSLKVYAVEPAESSVLSGNDPGPHGIQGIGAGFIPAIMQVELLDGIITVNKEEAFEYARNVARSEGILIGISSGASLAAVAKTISSIPNGSTVLTFAYDTGERYLSVEGLF